ncbi:MAG: methionine gamma-lyase family protein, partial [Lachnospiraceae bacterium]|nr:methionine gamma-lyase family protein [Lachnospiraceae bacterium]
MDRNMYYQMGLSDPVIDLGEKALEEIKERFERIDEIAEYNQSKVLLAMQKNRVDASCLTGTNGYGHDDIGRDTLEAVYASVFKTEAAIVRPHITCGTHALTIALSANLLPGDELL